MGGGGGEGTVVLNFPPIGGCQNGAAGHAPNNSLTREIQYETGAYGLLVRNRSQDGRSTTVALYVCNSHFEADNLNHQPSITEVFPATQGLTQLTTLLCSICHLTIYIRNFANIMCYQHLGQKLSETM